MLLLLAAAGAGVVAGFVVAVYLTRVRGFIFTDEYFIWSIGVFVGPSPFNLAPPAGQRTPVLTAASVTDLQASFVADPFIVREDGRWHMFFEAWDIANDRGVIALAASADGLQWSYDRVVVAEPFHLSYPQVFRWNGHYYLLPESLRSMELRLYRATAFPRDWEFAGTLQKGLFVDPTIFFADGRCWLLAQTSPRGNDRLSLYFADDLFGPWQEHPRSPVVIGDARHARPAGRVFRWENRLFRVAQDCDGFYGRAVYAFEILELSTTEYRERKTDVNPLLGPSQSGWNSHGMHHIDGHQLADGSWLAVVDGCRSKRTFGLR